MKTSSTKTTIRLPERLVWRLRALLADHGATLAIAGLLLAFALGSTWGRSTAGATVIIEATATPALTPLPTVAPVAAAARDGMRRLTGAVVCFAAPGGAALGAVDAGRRYETVERQGDWLALRFEGVGGYDGAGACWVRIADLTGAPDIPTPTPVIEYVFVSAPAGAPPVATDAPREAVTYPTMRPETAATVQAVWAAGPGANAASHLPPGADPLAGCVDGCRVFVTPALEGR